MRYTNTPEPARKYHYWRGFRTAAIVFGSLLLVQTIACAHLINVLVK